MKAVEKIMVRRAFLIEESRNELIKDIGSDVELLNLLNEERNRQLGSMINRNVIFLFKYFLPSYYPRPYISIIPAGTVITKHLIHC